MSWQKKGLIFQTEDRHEWMRSHAQLPVADPIEGGRLRIYFSTRGAQNRSSTTFLEVDASDPKRVLYLHDQPVLSPGELGCFDDSGVMPSWIVNLGGKKYLYYIGWNPCASVPYRLTIGLAISEDGGLTFERAFQGPVLDRYLDEPFLCTAPCVLVEAGIWRMWYVSGLGWKVHEGHPEPYYNVKYAESPDGMRWKRDGHVCIELRPGVEGGIGKPSVLKDGSIYRMWYSYRGGSGYRSDPSQSYRIGYAESRDGLDWTRMHETAGLDISETGWDSVMTAYPHVLDVQGRRIMFYNGNGFGLSGIGYALWEPES